MIADSEGAFKRWFDAAAGGVIILRPDRVVAAVCTPWQLNATLRQLAERMALDGRAAAARPEAIDADTTAPLRSKQLA